MREEQYRAPGRKPKDPLCRGAGQWGRSNAIRAAVRAVLADPTYRANARGARDEMAALPGPDYAVALLERLAREKRPVPVV